ncbi:MAG: hypothetical protein P4M15_03535 [Alphaproteobacteria bacterium]|nr:hypothetical protein [Alphaproteobacteria bacterium]
MANFYDLIRPQGRAPANKDAGRVPVRGTVADKPAWMTNPEHIAPSGKAYPRIYNQSWNPSPTAPEVREYIGKVKDAAKQLGIGNFEVWTRQSPHGTVVKFGTMDLLEYGRMRIFMSGGDVSGDFTHRQNFKNMSEEQINYWIATAEKMLDDNNVPYATSRVERDRVLFAFDRLSHQMAFSIAVEKQMVDQLMRDASSAVEFPNLAPPTRDTKDQWLPRIDYTKHNRR